VATVTPNERRSQLAARYPFWTPMTLSESLDRAAERYSDRPLVVTDAKTYSYREIRDCSIRLAAGLRALGIGQGDKVAVVLANVPEFVVLKYAIARLGATSVPVNFLFRANELGYVLAQSDAVALVTMNAFRSIDYLANLDELAPDWGRAKPEQIAPQLRHVVVIPMTDADSQLPDEGNVHSLADVDAMATPALLAEVSAASPATPGNLSDILYTSGTTGSPKGVMLTHDMVLRTAYASAYHGALQDSCRIQFSLPMYHVFGYIECLLAVTFVGGSIVPLVQFQPPEFLASMERHSVHEIVCVPIMTLALIAEAREHEYDLSSLVTAFSSGGPSPATIWQEIRDVLKAREIITAYGMSETTAATTCTYPEGPDELLLTNGPYRDAGAAGDPALGGHLAVYKVVDPVTEGELPPGSRGHLLVRGPMVTAGYYRKPQETAEAFDDEGWFRSGDIGVLAENGTLTLTGRLKESYRCGGEMVMPREIEILLTGCPGVAEAHIVGVSSEKMGEVGCAWIVPEPGAELIPEELIAFCASRVARFKVPAHVLFTTAEELPLTATGRVQKFHLTERAETILAARSARPEGSLI
jgi:fatty-acyl-CoA synthase